MNSINSRSLAQLCYRNKKEDERKEEERTRQRYSEEKKNILKNSET